jgi:hypothetical protein
MATRHHSVFNKIKATCDEHEMTKMMSFKYNWNDEIICQFYSTLYFDADGQKIMWMTDGQVYEIIVCHLARLLGLDHQLTMEPEARIHTFNILKPEEMYFMYAPGAIAYPLKTENFIPEINTLHCLLRSTLTLRIGDAIACPQYERNLIQFYKEKRPFSVFDFILQEIISISRNTLHNCGYAPQLMYVIEKVTGIDF